MLAQQQQPTNFHVEARVKRNSTARPDAIQSHVAALVASLSGVSEHSPLPFAASPFLSEHCEAIRVCEPSQMLVIHVYNIASTDEESCALDAEDDCDNTSVTSTATQLPSPLLEGLWESLVFDNDILNKLLNYVSTSSGKLVMKMFQNIKDLCENPDTFVCVLIDEVESLTAARKAACSGMEPSDAIRVVNALLTQIDSLKMKRNVLILTTSNITEAIDLAFVDRADLKLFVGLPSPLVIYSILSSTLSELMRCQLIYPEEEILSWRHMEELAKGDNCDEGAENKSLRLYSLCCQCKGLSGRAIRKLPFIAHALFVKSHKSVSLSQFLDSLEKAVHEEHEARKAM
ncbi:UNVERIFIED_CONTAM: Pachytene checkpoint protein 2 [Siphonaria sp. JEL0065]|nr:Pachytene checkpoint protein 2 [Siphonaria sp. JEL0065]